MTASRRRMQPPKGPIKICAVWLGADNAGMWPFRNLGKVDVADSEMKECPTNYTVTFAQLCHSWFRGLVQEKR